MESKLINENIFNRCIFKKSTKEEMKSSMEFYTQEEEFEKCVILRELLKLDYHIENPVSYDVQQMNEIIEKHKIDLDDLSELSSDLNVSNEEDVDDLLDDIDDVSDDIITNILESDKLRNEYLQLIYDEIIDIEMPPLEKDKHKDLLKSYRLKSIENLKRILK